MQNDIFDVSWATFESDYQDLANATLSEATIVNWLERWSDLEKRLRSVFVHLHSMRNTDTTNEIIQKAFKGFIEHIQPNARQFAHQLKVKLLACDFTPQTEHLELLRRFRNEVRLFQRENVPLEAQAGLIANEAVRLSTQVSEIPIQIGNESMSIREAQHRPNDEGRSTREMAWRSISTYRLKRLQPMGDAFVKLCQVRHHMAQNAGFENYLQFRWQQLNRFDYTPEDARSLHSILEKVVFPILTRHSNVQRRRMGVETLRPWDTVVSSQSHLPQIDTPEELGQTLIHTFSSLDWSLGERFLALLSGNRFDVRTNPGRMSGVAYCSHDPLTSKAFVFWNFKPTTHIYLSIAHHEIGHAFHHELACEAQNLVWNRPVPLESDVPLNIEINEIASQAMELFGLEHLYEGISSIDIRTVYARQIQFLYIASDLLACSKIDAFEQWAAVNAAWVTTHDLDAYWLELTNRFSHTDWSGLEDYCGLDWRQFYPLFNLPFYTLTYVIAWLGALDLYRQFLLDPTQTLARYKDALALGYSKPLPELFKAAGTTLSFDEGHITELMGFLEEQLEKSGAFDSSP